MSTTLTGPLTIGEFGRRSRPSAKALRLYDVSGLFVPAEVDPVTASAATPGEAGCSGAQRPFARIARSVRRLS
jgi:hypothetical protein